MRVGNNWRDSGTVKLACRMSAQTCGGTVGYRIHRRPQTMHQKGHHRADPLGAGPHRGKQLAAPCRFILAEQVRQREVGIGKIAQRRADDAPPLRRV